MSLLLPDQTSALPIEHGPITWVQGGECGVEFLQLPLRSRLRLNRTLRSSLIQFLERPQESGVAEDPFSVTVTGPFLWNDQNALQCTYIMDDIAHTTYSSATRNSAPDISPDSRHGWRG